MVERVSLFRRAVRFTGRTISFTTAALFFSLVGSLLVTATETDTMAENLHRTSAAESLALFVPQTDEERTKEEYINSHPLTASLRADPNLVESRPHMQLPPAWRKINLTAGTLMGPGKVTVPPFSWAARDGSNYVQISHVGTDLCGHVGIVHGGFLATMLDEGLARCCFPVLPHQVGVTAKLEINYKAPAMADQFLVLRARTTKVEGRKAWVEGHIETLPGEEGKEPTILATASALYVSPKNAEVSGNDNCIMNINE